VPHLRRHAAPPIGRRSPPGRRLRVAFVYRDFNRDGSIPSVYVARSERLSRDEHVTAVCSERSRVETDAPLAFETVEPLVRGRGRLKYALETGSFAARALRTVRRLRSQFDVVHGVGFATPEADLVTVNAVRPAEIAHYFDHVEPGARLRRHLNPLLRPQSLVVLAIERRLFGRHAPYCITHSAAIADDLVRHYGVPRDAVEPIPVGVDTRRFAGRPGGRAATRARLQVAQDAFVACFVGDEFERKGLDRAIRAVGRMRHDAELLVVGGGTTAPYESLARSLPPGRTVRFLGRLPPSELPDVYAAADVTVLPSRQDSWGHPVLESLAASRPVLVSEYTGAHEVVRDGCDGFVLEGEGSAEQLSSLLDRLAGDRAACAELGRSGRETALGYDSELQYERFRAAHHIAYERRLEQLPGGRAPAPA
jgi:glycosyltransferase involved in cell wall biosynthesis